MALPKLRSFKKNQKGFISIVALGIFALLVVFGMIVQESTGDSVESIKNTSKYYEAQDIADSVMEYLQYTMKDMEAGFSIVKETCSYSDGEYVGDGSGAGKMLSFQEWIEKWCEGEYSGEGGEIYAGGGCYDILGNNFEVQCLAGDVDTQCLQTWYKENQQLDDDTDGGDDNPVETPKACSDVKNSLSTLIAGKNVEITVNVEGKSEVNDVLEGCGDIDDGFISTCYSVPIPGEGTAGKNCTVSSTDTEDPCNWNKLKFGSSSTDRVSIPFYYVGETGIVNPFNAVQEEGNKAQNFVLRMRTPCKEKGENICEENDRYYVLNNPSKPVAQWQISGLCDGEECGMIPYLHINDDIQSSIITSEYINDYLHKVLIPQGNAIDTNSYSNNTVNILYLLSQMTRPMLTLYIGGEIIDDEGVSVPYLEYQLLTDRQIGQPTTKMEVIVSVDGNTYKKVLYQQEQKPLVDFAIQN